MKIVTPYNYVPDPGSYNDEESMTVPDCSIECSEAFNLYLQGLPITSRNRAEYEYGDEEDEGNIDFLDEDLRVDPLTFVSSMREMKQSKRKGSEPEVAESEASPELARTSAGPATKGSSETNVNDVKISKQTNE